MYINGVFIKKTRFFNRQSHFEMEGELASVDSANELELENFKNIDAKALKDLPLLQPVGVQNLSKSLSFKSIKHLVKDSLKRMQALVKST